MGLIKELLALPVAPVRFTVWVVEQVVDEADRSQHSPGAIVQRLEEIDKARSEGRLSDEEAKVIEAKVLEEHPAMPSTSVEGEGGADDG